MSDHSRDEPKSVIETRSWTTATLDRRRTLQLLGSSAVAVGVGVGSGTVGAQSGFDDLCEAVPLDVVLVLDRSGSMGADPDGDGDTKLDDLKAAATGFVDRLTSTDRVGLVSFASGVRVDSQLTNDFDAVKTAISALSDGGSTNLGGGIGTGAGELDHRRSDATPILIVLSNGLANAGPGVVSEATEAKSDGVRLISIALGSDADDSTLQAIASDPKGENFFDAPTGADLDEVFKTITEEICPTVVEINVKPGSDPNAINCGKSGVTPVAVLTTEGFDATNVDPSSLRFGRPTEVVAGDGARVVHDGGHYEDAKPDHGSKDGDVDFVGHFDTRAAGFSKSDEEGWLVGKTLDGEDFVGRDSVKIVGNCN